MTRRDASSLARLGGALLLGACLVSCTSAGSEPGSGLTIDHTPVTGSHTEGNPVTVRATVTAKGGVQSVTLFYRTPDADWVQLDMPGEGGDSYSADIPGDAVVAPEVQYYVAAVDHDGARATVPEQAPTQYYSFVVVSTADNDGPLISHVKVADDRPTGATITISAVVTDLSGVAGVSVFYRDRADDGGVTGDWQELAMPLVDSGASRYAVDLPKAVIVPPAVEYYLQATDNDSPTPHTSTVPLGAPNDTAPYSFTVTAGDVTPPVITHTPIADGQPVGRDVGVAADVTDGTGVASVKAFYRATGAADWTELALGHVSGASYAGVIPGSAVTAAGVDYYLEAQDTAPMGNVARDPSDAPASFHSFTAGAETCVVPPLAPEVFPTATLPGWWRTLNGAGAGCGWQLTSVAAHSAPYSAGHNSGAACDDRLVLPCLDLSTPPADGLVLDLWQDEVLTAGTTPAHSLEYTLDDPDSASPTWTVLDAALPIEQVTGWARRVVVIPPTAAFMGQAKVYLALRYVGDHVDQWAVDDVGVRLPAAAMTLAGTATTPETVTPGAGDVEVALTVTLLNTGEKASGTLTGHLATADPLITVGTATDSFAAAAPGATTAAGAFRLTVLSAHATGDVALTLHLDELNQDVPIVLYVGARMTATVQLTTGGGVGEQAVDLYLGIGHDYANPDFLSPRFNGNHLLGGTWTYTPDLSSQAANLPPSPAHPWFLKIVNSSYGSGTVVINQFAINVGTGTYTASGLPFRASDEYESYVPIPAPPVLAVDGAVTVPDPVVPGATNVALTVTLRNDGAPTSGAVTATLAPKDAATGDAVANLDTTTAHAFGAAAVAAGQKVAGDAWTFDVSSTVATGTSLAFVLTATDGAYTWHLDVTVLVP